MYDNEPEEKHLDFIATNPSVVKLLSPVKRQDFVFILLAYFLFTFIGPRGTGGGYIEDLRSRQMIMK